jgi:hypothetical protein
MVDLAEINPDWMERKVLAGEFCGKLTQATEDTKEWIEQLDIHSEFLYFSFAIEKMEVVLFFLEKRMEKDGNVYDRNVFAKMKADLAELNKKIVGMAIHAVEGKE